MVSSDFLLFITNYTVINKPSLPPRPYSKMAIGSFSRGNGSFQAAIGRFSPLIGSFQAGIGSFFGIIGFFTIYTQLYCHQKAKLATSILL
ncbi:hypothetical protein [Neobacillus cucumis]|uniref:hypothetical protein n=1 Tax=Neobacillus cucumis TaxID=1740721 RepID=UPI00196683C3|nr:hypothetical protein [Neobacillus cucumis]